MWTVVLFRSGDDPGLKNSDDEFTQGAVITYVDDLRLLIVGWQHHIDAISTS